MHKKDVAAMTGELCSALSRLGCEYDCSSSHQASLKSHYIYVRRPKYFEIRVSDHSIKKVKRRKTFDVGPHGVSVEQAVSEITELLK